MPETEPNAHPDAFANANLDEAVGRLVEIIRRLQPHVIITYADDQQGYKHPDHLRVHEISVHAFDRAADPSWHPEIEHPAWRPSKMYYSLWSRARMVAQHEAYASIDKKSPYDENWFKRRSLDHRITTKIDIAEWYGVRRDALLAHATQVDPTADFWFGLPDDVAARAYPYEDFILARSHVGLSAPESDLFAGVAPEAEADGAES